MRELAGKLRDEGDEGAREKKKNLRKKEERREAGEREREKENRKCMFNERRERSVIKIKNLASSYSMQLKIAAYCSSKTKIFSYTLTTVEPFLYFSEVKIAI